MALAPVVFTLTGPLWAKCIHLDKALTCEMSCGDTCSYYVQVIKHNLLTCRLGSAALILWLLGVMLPFYGETLLKPCSYGERGMRCLSGRATLSVVCQSLRRWRSLCLLEI